MRNTHLGILSTEPSLWLSLMVYVRNMSTRKAALSYAVLTWRTEWPSWLGKNLVFRGAQRGLSMRPAQCTTAPSYGPVGGQQRAVGLGGRRRAVRSLAGAEVEGTATRLPWRAEPEAEITFEIRPRTMATRSVALSWLRIKIFVVWSMELHRHMGG